MRVALYSSIRDKILFDRVGFYRDDIEALALRSDDVLATNSVKELLSFKPHMIVAYFFSKSILAAVVGRLTGAMVIFTGGADQISPAIVNGFRLILHRLLAFICLLLAHRILLSCSDDMGNFQKLCFGISSLKNKLELVNHVVIASAEPRTKQFSPPTRFDAFTMCWMGSTGNVRRKGIFRAVKLICQLRSIGINAKLEIAGTGGLGRDNVEELIRQLNLQEHVHLLGPISEQEKNYRMANGHVYLQLSDHEGFGVAAAEAFFSGMIVIHSNKGGLRDVIGHKGLVIESEIIDTEDIQAIKLFYKDFLSYKVDDNYLISKVNDFSIQMRSEAFFRGLRV